MKIIPIQSVPNQTFSVTLDGQTVTCKIYQRTPGLFFDLSLSGTSIVSGVICRNMVPLVCRDYAGFAGNLIFMDQQGESDPDYTGLGDRYQLAYLTAEEYALL